MQVSNEVAILVLLTDHIFKHKLLASNVAQKLVQFMMNNVNNIFTVPKPIRKKVTVKLFQLKTGKPLLECGKMIKLSFRCLVYLHRLPTLCHCYLFPYLWGTCHHCLLLSLLILPLILLLHLFFLCSYFCFCGLLGCFCLIVLPPPSLLPLRVFFLLFFFFFLWLVWDRRKQPYCATIWD